MVGFIFFKEVATMARIGRKGRLWLRGFHILFFGLWIGSGICEMIIILMAGNASDGGTLHAYYAANDSLNLIIIPSVILTLITGLLLCWLTTWGFFKNGWVVYSLVATIVALLIGAVLISPGEGDLLNISKTEGLAALQNPIYTSTLNRVIILHIIETVILISVIFISALKPWRKREVAEATS
jgi:hypothetical protein